MDDLDIGKLSDEIARRVKTRLTETDLGGRMIVPIGVSARHMHLTREVLEGLYGRGHQLRVYRNLSQVGEFAAEETVTLVGPKGRALEGVRLLGPLREFTQIELARSDGLRLGVDLPVRKTGDLQGSPGLTAVGPSGTVVLKQGAIRTTRHIHMSADDAARFGLRDGQVVRARVGGVRAVTLENVIIRVGDGFVLDFHVDTDDANASGADTGSFAEVIV
jgi:putative phosphotransacetylase